MFPPPTPAIFLVRSMSKASNPTESEIPKRLAAAQWAEAVALWELGEASLTELSDRYGLARETFSRKFKKLGIVKGSRAAEQADMVRQEIVKSSITDATILAERARATKEEHYGWASTMARLAMLHITRARNENRSEATASPALKAINTTMDILKKAREERWKCLGLDDETFLPEDLPDLVVRELTAQDIEDMRKRGFGDISDADLAMEVSDIDVGDEVVISDG